MFNRNNTAKIVSFLLSGKTIECLFVFIEPFEISAPGAINERLMRMAKVFCTRIIDPLSTNSIYLLSASDYSRLLLRSDFIARSQRAVCQRQSHSMTFSVRHGQKRDENAALPRSPFLAATTEAISSRSTAVDRSPAVNRKLIGRVPMSLRFYTDRFS